MLHHRANRGSHHPVQDSRPQSRRDFVDLARAFSPALAPRRARPPLHFPRDDPTGAPPARGNTVAIERGATSEHGMVATPHHLATEAGLASLRAGGTAIDAAVTANAVLTVIYPDQTAIGGDAFLLYHEAKTGLVHAYNGSGRAPRTADRAALQSAGFTTMPRHGITTVTVPGTIDLWDVALTRFGRHGLDQVLAPAIRFARDGFPVSSRLGAAIAALPPTLLDNPALSDIYVPGGQPVAAGATIRLPILANSLETIAREGRAAFYTGALAQQIAATSARLGGALSLDDLAAHNGDWVEPLTTTYRGMTVVAMPPNSQGFTALLALNLAALTEPSEWGSADHLHPLIEGKKLAFAVRDAQLADPDFAPIDTANLLAAEFARDLWQTYDPARAMGGAIAGSPDTVYLCAVDRDGNAASLIQSLYQAFGSGVVADGTGITLQNRGTAFSLADEHPNRLEPGKRPRHTLMPSMLLRDRALVGPIGTQGGDAQAQVLLQLITNLVDHGLAPQAAIDAPRWLAGGGPTDLPTTVLFEDGFPIATIADLALRGHSPVLVAATNPAFGHAQMILRDEASGLLTGAADPRADGTARGY